MKSLEQIFADSLAINLSDISDALTYQSIPQWDSVAHMTLIAAVEDEFGIMLDTDDSIDMSSVGKAKAILQKYGVEIA
jgi:acyl carrier protein